MFIRCRQINDDRRVDRDGRAERPPLPADLPPRLRARPGPNAYTGTGDELLNDPKVIELYLGTLAKATLTARRRACRHATEGPRRSGGPPMSVSARAGLLAGVEVARRGRCPCCRRASRSGCRAGRRPARPASASDRLRLLEADQGDGVGVGRRRLLHLGVEGLGLRVVGDRVDHLAAGPPRTTPRGPRRGRCRSRRRS